MQAALFGLMCLSWTGVHAGPFGLESGMTLVQLGRLEGFAQTDRSGWFTARQTPLHHPEFERYDFLIDPAWVCAKSLRLAEPYSQIMQAKRSNLGFGIWKRVCSIDMDRRRVHTMFCVSRVFGRILPTG